MCRRRALEAANPQNAESRENAHVAVVVSDAKGQEWNECHAGKDSVWNDQIGREGYEGSPRALPIIGHSQFTFPLVGGYYYYGEASRPSLHMT